MAPTMTPLWVYEQTTALHTVVDQTTMKPSMMASPSRLTLLLQMLHSLQMLFGKALSRLHPQPSPPLLLRRCCLTHSFLAFIHTFFPLTCSSSLSFLSLRLSGSCQPDPAHPDPEEFWSETQRSSNSFFWSQGRVTVSSSQLRQKKVTHPVTRAV